MKLPKIQKTPWKRLRFQGVFCICIDLISTGSPRGCGRVFVAQQAVGRLVFFDFGEAADGLVKAVVGVIVVALADLADEDWAGAGLDVKGVVLVGPKGDTLTGLEPDLGAGGDVPAPAVAVDQHIGIGKATLPVVVIDLDQHHPAAAVDDIL